MAAEAHNQEGRVRENFLRKQLSVAVRSIQWSYAIFWTISTKQPGVLKWGDGYYNGDIKTRKTMQPMEYNVDKLCLKRSEQLRDLYESLSLGDANQQARRPSASLSPEDLSDAEWYYLVCMSFTFNSGNGLPGRAYSSGQHIWLCNAPNADSKIFSRSLLAKSASIQTIVCFPFLGGVIELGVTESVMEDLNLIQHVKTVFLDFQILSCTEKSVSSPDMDDNEDHIGAELGHDIVESIPEEELNPQTFPLFVPSYIPQGGTEFGRYEVNELDQNIYEDVKADSPDDDGSNGYETNQFTEDSFMLEEMNGGPSQVQNWQFMDEELIHGSINSSDGISQTVVHPSKPISTVKQEIVNNLHLQRLQECDHTKLSSLDLGIADLHYTRTVSSILRNSNCLAIMPCSNSGNHKSSFVSWKRGSWTNGLKPRADSPQKILKKVLFDIARMHKGFSLKSEKENRGLDHGVVRPEGEDIGVSPFLSERIQVNDEQFLALRSLVPSNKFDKASVLGDTIEYLKDLQRRVEELESCRGLTEYEAKARRKHPDIVERTSDNYGNNDISKPPINKRKASDIIELDQELDSVFPKDSSSSEINVNINEKEVLIQMHCPWRDNLILEIMDAVSDLHLDAHTVQSSTSDGILTLTLNTKFKGVGLISDGTIKRAILTIIDTT
uniref:Putative GLABRA 3 transcription factor n=1 Tax=Epimedium sagittatum TaxID=253616 RepID=A0A0A7DN36_9MAGN|nr:putative GLABRA 3 transcription factor [Epimedium sagittatum]